MVYVEDCSLELPILKEGPTKLGQLYDCVKDELVDFSTLEPNKLEANHLDYFPVNSLEYELKHLTDTQKKTTSVSLGMKGRIAPLISPFEIWAPLGSFQYTTQFQSNFKKEHIQIHYRKETFTVRLLPSFADDKAAEDFVTSLKMGLEGATHIVTEVTYGSDLYGDIVTEISSSTKLKEKESKLLGKILIGPISKAVDTALGAVFKELPVTTTAKVNLESHPEISERQPETAMEMFKLINEFIDDAYLEKLKPFPNLPVRGIPVRLLLVPIKHFIKLVDDEDPPDGDNPVPVPVPVSKCRTIPEYLERPLYDMLCNLTDFQLKEFYRRKVTRVDSRLRTMMEDTDNPITKDIMVEEVAKMCVAKGLFKTTKDLMESYRLGEDDTVGVDSLKGVLEDYRGQFDLSSVTDKIDLFAAKGKRQLALLNADDVDYECKACFITSDVKLEKVLGRLGTLDTDVPDLQLILFTNEKEDAPQGVFLAMYNLSKGLKDEAVQVVMPGVDPVGDFKLRLWLNGKYESEYVGPEILFVLDFLAVAIGLEDGTRARFYQSAAALVPLTLPLESVETGLKPALDTLFNKWKDVIIYETLISLKAHVADPEYSNKWIFCTPVAYLSSLEAVRVLEFLKNDSGVFESRMDVEWIAGNFEMPSLDDAPLLILFRQGQPLAICLDRLDILALVDVFRVNYTSPNLTSLKKNSNFRSARARFANEINRIFSTSLADPVQTVVTSDLDLPALTDLTQNSLEIVKAALQFQNKELYLANALTRIAIKDPELSKLEMSLKTGGWSSIQNCYVDDILSEGEVQESLKSTCYSFIFDSNNEWRQVGAFFYSLRFCIQDYLAAQPEQDNSILPIEEDDLKGILNPFRKKIKSKQIQRRTSEEEINHFEIIDRMKATLEESVIPTEVKDKIKLFKSPADLKNCLEALNVLNEELIFNRPLGSAPYIQPVQDLLAIVSSSVSDNPVQEEGTSTRQTSSRVDGVTQKYLQNYDLPTDKPFPLILEDLSDGRYAPWLQEIYKTIQNSLDSMQDYDGLIYLLSQIKDSELSNPHLLYFIWKNGPLCNIIRNCLQDLDPSYKGQLVHLICTGEDEKEVPPYVPVDIGRMLKGMLEGEIGRDPSYNKPWTSIQDAVSALQSVVALKTFPDNFWTVFRRNLAANGKIKEVLAKSGVLIFWNEETKRFDQPWTLETVREAVEAYLLWVKKQCMITLELVPFEFPYPSEEERLEEIEADLVSFVGQMFPVKVKRSLCRLQFKGRNPADKWNKRWKEDKILQKSMSLFIKIILLKSKGTLELSRKLVELATPDCRNWLEYLQKLKREGNGSVFDPIVEPKIFQTGQEIFQRVLTREDFIREMFEIQELYLNHGTKPEIFTTFSEYLSTIFIQKEPLELFDLFRKKMNVQVLKDLAERHGTLRVFVISFVGDSVKREFRNDLFPVKETLNVDTLLETQGTLSLWPVPSDLKEDLAVDAFILVDLDEFNSLDENVLKKMTVFGLASSDLVLFCSDADKPSEDMLRHVDVSLVGAARHLSTRSMDILFIQCEPGPSSATDKVDIARRYLGMRDALLSLEIGLGFGKKNPMANIAKRAEEDTLCQLCEGPPGPSLSADKDLFTTILAACRESRDKGTFSHWVNNAQEVWNAAESSAAFLKHATLEDILTDIRETAVDLTRAKSLAESAVRKHAKECDDYLQKKLISSTRAHERLGKFTVKSWLKEQNSAGKLLETLTSHLKSVPLKCTPIGEDSAGRCDVCVSLESAMDLQLTEYISSLVQVYWSRLYQNYLVQNIEVNQEMCPEVLHLIGELLNDSLELKTSPDFEKLFQEIVRRLMDTNEALSSVRLLIPEIKLDYREVPFVIQEFMKTSEIQPWNLPGVLQSLRLKLDVEDLTEILLGEYDELFISSYQPGMIRRLKSKVNAVIMNYERRFEETLDYPAIWSIHLYALRRFFHSFKQMDIGNEKGGGRVVDVLNKYKDKIKQKLQLYFEHSAQQKSLAFPDNIKLLKYIKIKKPKVSSA